MVEGLLLGGLIGLSLGIVVGLSRWAEATVDPPLQMIRALPHLGLIPLFILWFGIGELPKVLLVALGVSFPLYLNTFSAIRQVDPRLFETAEVLGFSFWQRLRTIIIPSAAPQVLVGLRQSLAIAWLTLIVAEQINADNGIGYLINNARDFLRIDIIIFGLIVYALLGIGTDAIVRVLERRALEVSHMTVIIRPADRHSRVSCGTSTSGTATIECSTDVSMRIGKPARSSHSSVAAARGSRPMLRVFAGLSSDHTGDRTVTGAPALAFQEPRLFPWRDVHTNVEYGLHRTKLGVSKEVEVSSAQIGR